MLEHLDLTPSNVLYTIIFITMVGHMFSVATVRKWLHDFHPKSKLLQQLLHSLTEAEIVPVYYLVLIAIVSLAFGLEEFQHVFLSVEYIEPFFVFILVLMSSTKSIIINVESLVYFVSKVMMKVGVSERTSIIFLSLFLSPLLGSFVTEAPAAFVSATILKRQIERLNLPEWAKYLFLGTQATNVALGGALTSFAAPPVLLLASAWGWSLLFTLIYLGPLVITITFISSVMTVLVTSRLISGRAEPKQESRTQKRRMQKFQAKTGRTYRDGISFIPNVITIIGAVIAFSLHSWIGLVATLSLLLMFYARDTDNNKSTLKVVSSTIIGTFLMALLVIGHTQSYLIEPLLEVMTDMTKYISVASLTVILDNALLASLIRLGEQPILASQIVIVTLLLGAGGLSLLANVTGPVEKQVLQSIFEDSEPEPPSWFIGALPAFATVLLVLVPYVYFIVPILPVIN